VKANSSRWIHENALMHRTFAWQRGYSGFSVSESRLREAALYVLDQDAHHRKLSFQEELLVLLKHHGIQWDERYIWD
jgi:hypothetical protein